MATTTPTQRHKRIMSTFAKRLRDARVRKYVSAQKFAEKMGLDPHAYRKYERGETEPNFETLLRICEDLDVTTDTLLPLPDKKPPEAA